MEPVIGPNWYPEGYMDEAAGMAQEPGSLSRQQLHSFVLRASRTRGGGPAEESGVEAERLGRKSYGYLSCLAIEWRQLTLELPYHHTFLFVFHLCPSMPLVWITLLCHHPNVIFMVQHDSTIFMK